jgi:hypothetical protein
MARFIGGQSARAYAEARSILLASFSVTFIGGKYDCDVSEWSGSPCRPTATRCWLGRATKFKLKHPNSRVVLCPHSRAARNPPTRWILAGGGAITAASRADHWP